MPNLPQPNADPTVSGAIERYLERFARRVQSGARSPATLTMHRAHRDVILAALPPGVRLAELESAHLDELAAGDIAGATVRKRLSTLYGALRLAHRRGELAALPARPEVDHVYVPGQAHLRDVGELAALCAVLPPSRAEWVTAAVYSGMHASNLNAWRAYVDVDPFEGWMVLRNQKNRTPEIRVRMPVALARVLRARFSSSRLRPGHLALRTWSDGTRGHQLPAAARRAGLGPINATALRHTCGTWIVRRLGITPAAARWMGHRSTAMLERVYAHALPLQLEELTSELDSMEDAGDRRPPQKVSRRQRRGIGNPLPSVVDDSGGRGARTPLPPNSARGGSPRARRVDSTASDKSPPRLRKPVPRDRVELSTHGFSVVAVTPVVVESDRRAPESSPGQGEDPCTTTPTPTPNLNPSQ